MRALIPLLLVGCASAPRTAQPEPHPGATWQARLEKAARSPEAWRARSEDIRRQILVSSGLWPEVDRGPVQVELSGRVERDGYSVEKCALETLPGFKLTATLYRPLGKKGPFPAVANPHGHWKTGRFTDQAEASVPGRCINFARMGMVALAYDMVGFGDLTPLGHKFGDVPWGVSLQGLQLWNSLKVVDFLCSLPEVDKTRVGVTGASGGGTQTFLLAAVDQRVTAAVPVNMVAAACQGGCLCENGPLLRLDLNNVEIAASIAPRAALMLVSCTGDWTSDVPKVEGPAVQKAFDALGVPGKFRWIQNKADHNYNKDTREYVYAFFQEHLLGGPKVDRIAETPFTAEPRESMTLPVVGDLVRVAQQMRQAAPDRVALRHTFGIRVPAPDEIERKGDVLVYKPFPGEIQLTGQGSTLWVSSTPDSARMPLPELRWTLSLDPRPREAPCNEGVRWTNDSYKKWMDPYPSTYYRTPLARGAQDVLAALAALPDVDVAAQGESAVAVLIARALRPGTSTLDLTGVDDSKIAQPGWLRLGGLKGVASLLAGQPLTLIHPPFDAAPLKEAWAAAGKPEALKVIP
ncbi:MAG TPA: acyl-CoA thioester hydrolase/BAAT C-terminal domain-containing protein [Planctomycetota bacterium]